MRSVAPMRIAKIGYIAISALMSVLGVMLIIFPQLSIRTVGITCGILLIVFGMIKIVGYFSKDLFRLAFENDLAGGILMIALGSCLFLHTKDTLLFFCTVLGILILSDGLFKVQIAMDAKPFGIRKWWLILVAAVVTCVFGCVLIFRPSASLAVMTELLGISLILDGVLNISTVLTAVKIINNQYNATAQESVGKSIDDLG